MAVRTVQGRIQGRGKRGDANPEIEKSKKRGGVNMGKKIGKQEKKFNCLPI